MQNPLILLNSREATDVCRETFPDLEVLALTVKYFAPVDAKQRGSEVNQ